MNVNFNVTDFFKLPTKIMAALALGTGIILFLPDFIIKKMYLNSFRSNYGFIIGIVFIISVTIFTVTVSIEIFKYFKNRKATKWFIDTAGERLSKLSNYQKVIVCVLYKQDNHTYELPLHDGAVQQLEHDFIIQKATTQYMVNNLNDARFPYFLQPWVINELQKNDSLAENFMISYANFTSSNKNN
ncbi:super-infection exclusion protein B [Enterococcus faecalis]|uniref:super-infection exclusion protein B n=1 Tax=Enterococcus faecalis TaxID=1351 RepID=UPI001157CDDD|nr:super-infection exclusion protein B [Enterococcus faecalis]MDN3138852.1 super-infection exclusion protein B [Enterococcus faecalis]